MRILNYWVDYNCNYNCNMIFWLNDCVLKYDMKVIYWFIYYQIYSYLVFEIWWKDLTQNEEFEMYNK